MNTSPAEAPRSRLDGASSFFYRYVAGRLPRVYVAALTTFALLLAWLGSHGFPTYTADALPVKQPAIMYLREGLFSVPNYAGIFPYAELKAMAYPPLYTFFNLATFKILGISIYASLTGDLFVHFLLVALVSWLLLKVTRNQLVAGVFAFLSLHIITPIGRQEELAILLGIAGAVSFAIAERRLLGAFLLSLCLMTSPPNGIKAWLLTFALLAVQTQGSGALIRMGARLAGFAAVSLAVALAVWAAYVYPHFSEAIAQFESTRERSYQPSLKEVFTYSAGLTKAYIAWLVIVTGFGVPWLRWARVRGASPRLTSSIAGMALALPAMLAVNALLRRPIYDYRFDACVGLAAVCAMVAFVFERLMRFKPAVAYATLGGLAAVALTANLTILRYTLAPFAWDADAVTLGAAIERLRRIIPKGASIGGDAAFLSLTADYPRYVMFYSRTFDQWPEYVIAGAWAFPDNLGQRSDWADYLSEAYEPVPEGTDVFTPGCALKLFGLRVPVAHGTCDFKTRVWRRKAPALHATPLTERSPER